MRVRIPGVAANGYIVASKQFISSAREVEMLGEIARPADLSDQLVRGRYLVMTTCSECHGQDLMGRPIAKAPGLMVVKGYDAAQFTRLMREGVAPEALDEAAISSHLYTGDLPEPDLLIRTGGDQRISNFLLWQAAYAELYFCERYWPDFGPADLDAAIAEFARRARRFGR